MAAHRRWGTRLVVVAALVPAWAAADGPEAPRGHVVHDADRWLARLLDVESDPAVVRIGADGHISGRWSGDNAAAAAAAVEGF